MPDTLWIRQDDGWMTPLRRQDHPETWTRIVESDTEPVITQVDDGATEKGVWQTSSGSAPTVMAEMINLLDVQPGMRVLEIGTGTGYNAAVLSTIVGPENVTTIELDSELAKRARKVLDKEGYPVQVVAGDGEFGYPQNSPYDRIIVTAAAHTVPYAWVEQTKPGGKILVPWGATFHPDWPFALLTVQGNGTGEGRFVGPAAFMPLRGQRVTQAAMQEAEERWKEAGRPDCTRYGVTVTPEGQRIWLDSLSNVV